MEKRKSDFKVRIKPGKKVKLTLLSNSRGFYHDLPPLSVRELKILKSNISKFLKSEHYEKSLSE